VPPFSLRSRLQVRGASCDVSAIAGRDTGAKAPALDRLEAAIGRDFADRLVAALSDKSVARD
jgi:hypothetical protein